jgi:hypothetical protein
MDSTKLNISLVFLIFTLFLLSFLYHNYIVEKFYQDDNSLSLLKSVKAHKFTKPNDTEYYGLKKEDRGKVGIGGGQNIDYSKLNPISWNCLDKVFDTSMTNRVELDDMIGRVFKSTKASTEAFNALKLN